MHLELSPSLLRIDPTNYRSKYTGIDKLADSIKTHGLLQNLVVAEDPDSPGCYIVKAGCRRLLAIFKLIADGDMPKDERVLCLVVSEDIPWIQLTENSQRVDVPSWQTGFRFLELSDAGYPYKLIAEKLCLSYGTVSSYTRIAKGLHPDIIAKLEKLGPKPLNNAQLLSIARLLDEYGAPVLAAQTVALDRALALFYRGKDKKPKKRDVVINIKKRLKALMEDKISIPRHARPYVEAVLDYLTGKTRQLTFRDDGSIEI